MALPRQIIWPNATAGDPLAEQSALFPIDVRRQRDAGGLRWLPVEVELEATQLELRYAAVRAPSPRVGCVYEKVRMRARFIASHGFAAHGAALARGDLPGREGCLRRDLRATVESSVDGRHTTRRRGAHGRSSWTN